MCVYIYIYSIINCVVPSGAIKRIPQDPSENKRDVTYVTYVTCEKSGPINRIEYHQQPLACDQWRRSQPFNTAHCGSEASPAIARAARKLSRDSRSAKSGRASFDQDGVGAMLHVIIYMYHCCIIIKIDPMTGCARCPTKIQNSNATSIESVKSMVVFATWDSAPGRKTLATSWWRARRKPLLLRNFRCERALPAEPRCDAPRNRHSTTSAPNARLARPVPGSRPWRCDWRSHHIQSYTHYIVIVYVIVIVLSFWNSLVYSYFILEFSIAFITFDQLSSQQIIHRSFTPPMRISASTAS